MFELLHTVFGCNVILLKQLWGMCWNYSLTSSTFWVRISWWPIITQQNVSRFVGGYKNLSNIYIVLPQVCGRAQRDPLDSLLRVQGSGRTEWESPHPHPQSLLKPMMSVRCSCLSEGSASWPKTCRTGGWLRGSSWGDLSPWRAPPSSCPAAETVSWSSWFLFPFLISLCWLERAGETPDAVTFPSSSHGWELQKRLTYGGCSE